MVLKIINMKYIFIVEKNNTGYSAYAVDAAGWWWKRNNINEDTDKDDIKRVTLKVNKMFFIIITLILLSYGNQQVQNKEEKRDYPLIDYQRDSVYYLLDVRGDSEKEKLLVTREVMVQDSIFGGGENRENWRKAWKYADTLFDEKTYFLYKVYIYENEDYKKITELIYNIADIAYPILRAGDFSSHHKVFSEMNLCRGYDTQYLKIVSIDNDDLNAKCINLSYVEGKWVRVSSEQLIYRDQKSIYCIDTTDCYDYTNERIEFSRLYYTNCIEKDK